MLTLTEDLRERLVERMREDGTEIEIGGLRFSVRWWQVDDVGANHEVWLYVGNLFVPNDLSEEQLKAVRE